MFIKGCAHRALKELNYLGEIFRAVEAIFFMIRTLKWPDVAIIKIDLYSNCFVYC